MERFWLLQQLRGKKETSYHQVCDRRFAVSPGVWTPGDDTRLLCDFIERTQFDSRANFVDLTTGSGVVAVTAGLKGLSGLAVDFNSKAVDNARENVVQHGLGDSIACQRLDVTRDSIRTRFDYLFANGPHQQGEVTDDLSRACLGAREFNQSLLSNVGQFMHSQSLLFMVYAWMHNVDNNYFSESLEKNDLEGIIVSRQVFHRGKKEYQLYAISPKTGRVHF